MATKPKNMGASVRARLLKRAQDSGTDFQILLLRYALERLLYRLSCSPERDRFVLKGAMLFVTWRDDPFRPTRDLDLLGQGDSDVTAIGETFRAICAATVDDDGVVFDAAGVKANPIRSDQAHGGVRIRTMATIDKAQVPIQIDIGFGDAITPGPIDITYPVMLDGPAPTIKAYPVETVIAEKTEALVSLGMANTRLKDFYDLWFITTTFELHGDTLSTALRRTFERRGTAWPTDMPTGLSDAFIASRTPQWRTFIGRDQLAAPADFADIVTTLRTFLLPVFSADAVRWQPGGPWSNARKA